MAFFQSIVALVSRIGGFATPIPRGGRQGSAPASAAPRRLMTVQEVAALLHVDAGKVFSLCHGGGLPHVRLCDAILVRAEELQRWLDHHATDDR